MALISAIRIVGTALACSFAIIACGGNSDSAGSPAAQSPTQPPPQLFTIGGTVTGLSGSGLALLNNAGDELAVHSNGSFKFATSSPMGAAYLVTVKNQPASPSQVCAVNNGSGTVGGEDVTSAAIVCTTNAYAVGGSVHGMSGSGLVLQNNAGDDLLIANNGGFSFSKLVPNGSAYSITIKAQPTSPAQFCVVSNGVGTVSTKDIIDVAVNCEANYTGIVPFGSSDPSIVMQSSLTSAASINGLNGGAVTGAPSFDAIKGILPGATGGAYFQSLYSDTRHAGQLSIEVERAFISQPSPDQFNGNIGGSEGYNHLADGFLTILDLQSSDNIALGGVGLTNLAAVGGNFFQTNFIGKGVHSAGKSDFVKITLSWVGNTCDLYIDGFLHNTITLPPIGSPNRLDIGKITVGYSPPGALRIQNYYIRNLVLARRPVTFPPHPKLSKVVIYGDSFASQANPIAIGSTHFDSRVGFQIIRKMNNHGYPIGQLLVKDYSGEVLNRSPAPGQTSFQLGTNRFGGTADKLADVVNANADYVIIMGGTNDATGDAAVRGALAPNFLTDLLSLCRTILNNSRTKGVIVQTIMSVKGHSTYASQVYVENVAAINAIIRSLPTVWNSLYPAEAGKVKAVDTFAATGGETAAANMLKGTLTGALDDLHPAAFASAISGNLIADALLDFAMTDGSTAGLLDFKNINHHWALEPERFKQLWQSARTRTVRIAMLGDSQETSPGGAGSVYIPYLNYELWRRFRNVPETFVAGGASYGSGSPWGDWLLRGSLASPGPSPSRLAASYVLPNMSPKAHSTTNGNANLNGEWYGQLTMLQQNAIDVNPAATIGATADFFNTTGVVKARIFAATNASSGEIFYRARPSDSHVPNYYEAVTTLGSMSLGLESGTFKVKAGDTSPLQYNGKRYMQLEISGNDDAKLTDILGMRIYNETHPEGVVVNAFSAGGYKAHDFVTAHGNARDIFRALEFSAVILHFGANDIAADLSARDFQMHIGALVALLRSWTANPELPVILVADTYRNGLSDLQAREYARYVGATLAIARTDKNVMIVNSRQLMDEIGWNASSGRIGDFLTDCCHYTPYGAQQLAAAEVAAMLDGFVP